MSGAKRFIMITPCVIEEFFLPVQQGARDASASLDVDYEFTGTDEVDIATQVEMVRRAVADGYHGIALSICHATAFNDAVAEALDVKIPVVAFNIDDRSGNNPRLAGISQNFRDAGRKLGKVMAAHVPAGSSVLLTKHSEGIPALEERIAGVEEVLSASGIASKVIVCGMFASEASTRIATELSNGLFAGIVGTGQADTEGAGVVIEQLPDGQRIPVVGFDLSPEILRLIRGKIVLCAVDQQPYLQGFYPIMQLTHHIRYGLMPSDIDAGSALVTAANAESVMHMCTQGYR